MSWLTRYRIRRYVQSSVWVVPASYFLAAIIIARATYKLEQAEDWRLFRVTMTGAVAALSAAAASTLSFMVFVFTILLLVFQFASAQLSPRILTTALNDRVVKHALGVFVASFLFTVSTLARISDPVPQFRVTIAAIANFACIIAFLVLLDHVSKALRPVTLVSRVAEKGKDIIQKMYPHALPPGGDEPSPLRAALGPVSHVVLHAGASGVLEAFSVRRVVELARDYDCIIEIVPEVGDFVAFGEPLLEIHGGRAKEISENAARSLLATGIERTLRQDPTFSLRILVDIAAKALSPAINDPTTAVTAIDQVHRLLRIVGQRDLDTGLVNDRAGKLRLVYRTPGWDDFVWLGMTEIRQFGATSVQVMRRLRAMIDSLMKSLPSQRHPALIEQRELLDATVARTFADPRERKLATTGDLQGMGGSEEGE